MLHHSLPSQAARLWRSVVLALGVSGVCFLAYHVSLKSRVIKVKFESVSEGAPLTISSSALSSSPDAIYKGSLQKLLLPTIEKKTFQNQTDLSKLRLNSISAGLQSINIDRLTATQVALTLHSYLDNLDLPCQRKIRMGSLDDGGYEVCDDPDVRPVAPCLIYSLGIGKDWTFDDDVTRLYGCHVYAFDPSLGKKKHDRSPLIHFFPWGVDQVTRVNEQGWQLYTMGELKQKLGHKVIDIVKMDIEHFEWRVLPDALTNGHLEGVKQLLVEFHIGTSVDKVQALKTMQALEKARWKRFYVFKNPNCATKHTGVPVAGAEGFPVVRTACYEVMLKRELS